MLPRPPSCQGCQQPPKVFISLVAGAKAHPFACCGACPCVAKAAAGTLPSLALGVKFDVPSAAGRGRCPACGFRWSDFERVRRLGCPSCYEAHSRETVVTIARAQPGLVHTGRRPAADETADPRGKIASAKQRLREALAEEDYETAAVLRDLIAELENGGKNASP
ncbi:MAG: UvrB/UvrC motif-containing protein [Verrucomicrobiota bacterium]